MSNVIDNFLQYVKIDTRSIVPDPEKKSDHPSSKGQSELASLLRSELAGSSGKISIFDDGSFLIYFPANDKSLESSLHVAFASHLDTYYELAGNAKPTIHSYRGGDLVINSGKGISIPAPELKGLDGKQIITSDGTTLLGADDKAGVAAMMQVISLIDQNDIKHGPLSFWFCVDEEISSLDVGVIPKQTVESWDILWTLDGERLGPIDIGCLIGARCSAMFEGVSAHPGVNGDKLKPAQYAAITLGSDIIAHDASPMETSGMQPFGYIDQIEASSTHGTVIYLPRAFDQKEVERMIEHFELKAREVAEKFEVKVKTRSHLMGANTRCAAEKRMDLLQPAIDITKKHGYKVELLDIRGGTDGGMLNLVYPDLPAPNMGTGSANLHTTQEFLVVEELEKLVEILVEMIDAYGIINK